MHQTQVLEAEPLKSAGDEEWAERCRFWLAEFEASIPKRKRRERQAHPLILTGNGMSIRVDRGALLIRDGLTHYPQDVREHRFFPGGLENPQRIIMVDGNGQITLDAIDWLAEQNIALIRLRWDGRVISVVGQRGYSADPVKVAWQIETRKDEAARVGFGVPLLQKKLGGTLENLLEFFPGAASGKRAARTVEDVLRELHTSPPHTIDALLGLEGKAANAYFAAWAAIPIRWKGLDNRPVPEDWLTYKSRSALREKKPSNRRATHPVNAMLNYSYGMLESRTRISVVADGCDPTRGIVHGDGTSERDAYVLDLMEPGRPVAERAVLSFVRENEQVPSDFLISSSGTTRLDPQLAKRLAALSF